MCGFEAENFIKALAEVTSVRYVKSKIKSVSKDDKVFIASIDKLLIPK